MATMGVRVNDPYGGSNVFGKLADTLATAMFGSPELEMKIADLRSNLLTDEYNRRQIDSAIAYNQARTEAEQTELAARQAAGNVAGGMIYDAQGNPIAAAPAPVEEVPIPVPTPRPDPAAELPAFEPPAPVATEGPFASFAAGYNVAPPLPPTGPILPVESGGDYPQLFSDMTPEPFGAAPVPVEDPNAAIMPAATGDVLPANAPVPEPQGLPGPQEDVGTVETPQGRARMTREQANALGLAAQFTSDPAGQSGKWGGYAGILYGDPNDPRQQAQNALLYAGKTAGESAGAESDLVRNLRKDFAAAPAFQEWEIVRNSYSNMRQAMDTLASMQSEDDPRRGPADMRLIYNYLKSLDPRTGVKEGEYASAEQAGGKVAPYLNLYNSIVAGDKLDPRTRAAFLQQAAGMYDVATQNLEPLIKQYKGEAAEFNIEPGRIIRDMPTYEDWKPPPQVPREGVTEDMIQQTIQDALPDVLSRDEAILWLNSQQATTR